MAVNKFGEEIEWARIRWPDGTLGDYVRLPFQTPLEFEETLEHYHEAERRRKTSS